MKKKKVTVLFLVTFGLFVGAIFALVLMGSLQEYYLSDHSGATVYSKGDEAYLFLGSGHTGYRFSYLKYPLVVLGEYFNSPPSPSDQRAISTVMRVTPSGVERHVIDYDQQGGNAVDLLTPFDDGFYGMCSGGILCKWTQRGFEPATEAEQRRHDGTNGLFRGNFNNQRINGWFVREIRRTPGDHFEVQVGDKLVIAAKNQATDHGEHEWISVDLLRAGKPPERLYDVNGTPRRVSQTEYERSFQ
jgi:hypothetical protein